MFRENKFIQQSLFNRFESLPNYLKEKIQKSWAQTFRDKIFPLINEKRFSVLYSDKASRPNSPVNVIISLLIIKEMYGFSDDDLVGFLYFDFICQYALYLENQDVPPISENTFTNFRNRVYAYEKETGIDLIKEEIEYLSKKFTEYLDIDGKKLRMDSLMVSSSCKKMSRLELVYTVIYKFIKELGNLDEVLVPEEYKVYLNQNHRKEFIYKVKNNEIDDKLTILLKQAYELFQYGIKNEKINTLDSFNILARLVTEQLNFKEDNTIEVKSGKDITPESLQSASDPDATFRKKYNNNIGYVANIVESFDNQDEDYTKSIITSYDYRQNIHSDIDFGREFIDELISENQDNQEEIEMIQDGSYYDQNLVDKASDNNIKMYFTNLVGKKPNQNKLSCTEFKIDDKENIIIECPNGQTPIRSNFTKGVYSAHFDTNKCKECPLKDKCISKIQKKSNVVRFSNKTFKAEQVRKYMSTKEYKIKTSSRAGIEGIPSALRRSYNVDHMPVRGFLRSKMYFGFKVAALNVKRLLKGIKLHEK